MIEPLESDDPSVLSAYAIDDIRNGTVTVKLVNLRTEVCKLAAVEII